MVVQKYTHLDPRLSCAVATAVICDTHTSQREEGESTDVELASEKVEGRGMKKTEMARLVIVVGFGFGLGCGLAMGQSAGQDMKDAGKDTKAAAVHTGHATAKTTKKAYHKTKHGTQKAYHKTVQGTKKVGDKVAGKPDSQ